MPFDKKNYDPDFLRIVQETARGKLLGELASWSYDPSVPEDNYIGGAEKWSTFRRDSNYYIIAKNDKNVLSRHAQEMADIVSNYTNTTRPTHLHSVGPGSKEHFIGNDLELFKAFNRTSNVRFFTTLDINKDFAETPRSIIAAEFNNVYINSAVHDIFADPLPYAFSNNEAILSAKNRRSVVLCTGSTSGNLPTDNTMTTFPKALLVSYFQDLVDSTAAESFLIVGQSAQSYPKVKKSYSEPVHATFALSVLHRIKRELPTRSFDPKNFYHDTEYDEEMSLLRNVAKSKHHQTFSIGDEEFSFAPKEIAFNIGNSFQITNSRMGEIAHEAGFIRVQTFTSKDKTFHYQILQASPKLLKKLKKRNSLPRDKQKIITPSL